MKHNTRFVWLDLTRGACALAVCAVHLRGATIRDYAALPSPSRFDTAFYFFTGLGHQYVMVFFVLSGFFVGGSILRSGPLFRPADYAVARMSRLWTVLIPALLFTLLVDRLTAAWAPKVLSWEYVSVWDSGQISRGYSSSLLTFLGNTFFLQTILTPVLGTNGVVWSLANEFWYYATFPMFTMAMGWSGGLRSKATRVVLGVAAILLGLFLNPEIRSGYVVWLMGVGVYWACQRLPNQRRYLWLILTFGVFLGSLCFSKAVVTRLDLKVLSDLVVGLAFSGLCVVLAAWPPFEKSIWGTVVEKFSRAISEFSYSLYLCHFPLVVLIAGLGYQGTKSPPDREGLFYFFFWYALLLMVGALFWCLFERNTERVKRWISSRFLKPRLR